MARAGKQYDQLPASYMSLGTQLQAQVPNPFYGKIPYTTGSLAQPTVSYMQLLRPYPEYTGIQSYRKPIAQSIYHAMTIRADKRFGNGMSILLAYTAGKEIDNASSAVSFIGGIAGTHLDFYNWKNERSIGSFDISQRAVISYVYELPFGRNKKLLNTLPKVPDMLVKGWQVNGITTFQTGLPIYITGITNNTNIGASSQRANNNGKSAFIDHGAQSMDQKLTLWFDPTVFSQPPAFTFGNVEPLASRRSQPGDEHHGPITVQEYLLRARATVHRPIARRGVQRVQPLQSGSPQHEYHEQHCRHNHERQRNPQHSVGSQTSLVSRRELAPAVEEDSNVGVRTDGCPAANSRCSLSSSEH